MIYNMCCFFSFKEQFFDPKDKSGSLDYIAKVLFPETLIKIFMDTQDVEYIKAEEKLFLQTLQKVFNFNILILVSCTGSYYFFFF